MRRIIFTLLLPFSLQSFAAEKLESVSVTSETQSNLNLKLKDDVIHTEVVGAEKIEHKQAASLAQAIEDEPGVKVNTDCSMCGVKRVMLNGLKGEHTTILTNGVANSSLMEGFYGFDAIPTAGVSSVEIARGAGASLVAPEAIGGVVNIVINKPENDLISFDMARGSNDYHKYQFVGQQVSEDKKTAFALAAQSDHRGQVDTDNNWVNESPSLTNRAMNLQIWHQLSAKDAIDFRIEDQYSEVFGGPMVGSAFAPSKSAARVSAEGDAEFRQGNVGNKPSTTTNARDFLENIITTKQAYTAKWTRDISNDLQTRLTASYVDSTLDSIYEGVTYKADQDIYYVDARANYFLNEQHELLIGVDNKQDNYDSVATGGTQNTAGDAYVLNTRAFYIRDFWTPSDDLEVSVALRVDQIDVDFKDQDRQFDDTIFAPRLHMRYLHDFNWTSRFSAGQGYRIPLAFFETDHGIVDNPLVMAVDKLEKSNSLQYSLAFTGALTSFETSYSWTSVDNLAMIDDSDTNNTKVINSDDTGSVQHFNISADHQLTAEWALGASAEIFVYDKAYRDTFGVIPTEERIKLFADFDYRGWEVVTTVTWVGSRDYADYEGADYLNHYEDKTNSKDNGKSSPSYTTLDMKISKALNQNWKVYAGGTNLTDYTQTGQGSSPLFYDTDGNADVTHIWGPLRGREIYAGVKASF